MKQIKPIKYIDSGKYADVYLTERYPFPMSNIKVNKAMVLLPVLKTFVAPIFPEPIFLTSFFRKSLVKIKPNGMEPMKYDNRDKIAISIF